MTELTFLVDLLLNHKLPKLTRDAVAARIKEVEEKLATLPGQPRHSNVPSISSPIPPHLVGQSPSTIAAMMRHEQAGLVVPPPAIPAAPPPPLLESQSVAVIAQTPAAAAALAERQTAIAVQLSGKPAKGETRPRKW